MKLYKLSLKYTDIFRKNEKCNPFYIVAESKKDAVNKYYNMSNGKAEIISVSYLSESLNYGNTAFHKGAN